MYHVDTNLEIMRSACLHNFTRHKQVNERREFQAKMPAKKREREHYEGKSSSGIYYKYGLQISPLFGERNLAHQRASGLT